MSAPPALAGIVVLDLTQIYNGPYCTFMMARAGATVIKIEPPQGEHLRKRERSPGVTMPFAALNGGKRAITLNLKSPAARDVFRQLVGKADVVVENFAPGVMQRLGLGEAALRELNPRLVYASGSGYGTSGPYRDYPAMDLTMQAMSGVMSVTGTPDAPPVKAGPAICDFFGGAHLYGAIVTALLRRAATGQGSTVEVAMLDSVYPTLVSNLGLHREGETHAVRTGNRHGGLSIAPYNVYPASDGYFAILSINEKHWKGVVQALELGDLADDPRFSSSAARIRNMDEVDRVVSERTATQTRAALSARLIAARVPCAPVQELHEVVVDPHLHATGMIRWIDHPEYGRTLVHDSPIVFSDLPRGDLPPSPRLGEHNREVLGEFLGVDAESFGALEHQGAFSATPEE